MSHELDQRLDTDDLQYTTSPSGAFISEDAVRGALQRRARDRRRDGSASAVGGRTKLRRWSVAELIARAAPRPPAGGVAN